MLKSSAAFTEYLYLKTEIALPLRIMVSYIKLY